jgi:hypothetical protein
MMSHSGWRGTVDLSTGNTTADVLFSNSVTGVTETSVDLTLTGQTKTKSGAKAKDGQTFDLSSTTMKGAPSL